jgi:hypothetical protein
MTSPIIDIHTHCSPRPASDPFGVAAVMRGVPVGKNAVTNLRDLVVDRFDDVDRRGRRRLRRTLGIEWRRDDAAGKASLGADLLLQSEVAPLAR